VDLEALPYTYGYSSAAPLGGWRHETDYHRSPTKRARNRATGNICNYQFKGSLNDGQGKPVQSTPNAIA